MQPLAPSALCLLLLGVVMAAPAHGQSSPRRVVDLTTGIKFAPPLLSIGESPSEPGVVYVGTRWGRVHFTRDGGASWGETNALVARGAFFGGIRPWGGPSPFLSTRVLSTNSPGAIDGLLGGSRFDLGPRSITSSLDDNGSERGVTGRFPRSFGEAGLPSTGLPELLQRDTGGAGGGSAGGGSRLGVGLRNTAPRLAQAVRAKRGWQVGIALKPTLALKAANATAIQWLDVSPRDARDVLAATEDGLRRSRDGGYSWPLVLTGASRDERTINHVVRDPRDPDTVYVGTGRGLHVSTDGGETWSGLIHPYVNQSDVRFITFQPDQPDALLVGLSWGIVRSPDRGKSFELLFRSSLSALAKQRRLVVDPSDPKRILAATADGLLVSEDAGANWTRAGGLQFVGHDMRGLVAGKKPGHFVAATGRDVWESFDGGQTWQVVYFGAIEWTITQMRASLHDPEVIWVLTEGEVLRLERSAGEAVEAWALDRFRAIIGAEPPVEKVVQAALERAGVDRPSLNAYRRRARSSGWLPVLSAGLWWSDAGHPVVRLDRQLGDDPNTRLEVDETHFLFAVNARWTLDALLHSRSESVIDRVGGQARSAEWTIRQTVIALYAERRRLIFEDLIDRGDDPRRSLMRALRLEELAAHLNALAGEMFRVPNAL